jgi:hypothetical protein
MTEKIWIYVLSKELNEGQLTQFIQNCKNFTGSWTAHDQPLSASFELYKNRLLIMKVDESAYNASGCSIDKLQRFIQLQEKEFDIQLLNRLLVALEVNDKIMVVHSSQIKELLSSKVINENTLVYDTVITSSYELKNWKKPLKDTWLCKYLSNYSSK